MLPPAIYYWTFWLVFCLLFLLLLPTPSFFSFRSVSLRILHTYYFNLLLILLITVIVTIINIVVLTFVIFITVYYYSLDFYELSLVRHMN